MASHIDYLRAVFPDINFKIRSKISDEIEHMFDDELAPPQIYQLKPIIQDPSEVLRILEAQLRKVKKDYNQARKKFMKGQISTEELQKYEMEIFDLQQQIENLKSGD